MDHRANQHVVMDEWIIVQATDHWTKKSVYTAILLYTLGAIISRTRGQRWTPADVINDVIIDVIGDVISDVRCSCSVSAVRDEERPRHDDDDDNDADDLYTLSHMHNRHSIDYTLKTLKVSMAFHRNLSQSYGASPAMWDAYTLPAHGERDAVYAERIEWRDILISHEVSGWSVEICNYFDRSITQS